MSGAQKLPAKMLKVELSDDGKQTEWVAAEEGEQRHSILIEQA